MSNRDKRQSLKWSAHAFLTCLVSLSMVLSSVPTEAWAMMLAQPDAGSAGAGESVVYTEGEGEPSVTYEGDQEFLNFVEGEAASGTASGNGAPAATDEGAGVVIYDNGDGTTDVDSNGDGTIDQQQGSTPSGSSSTGDNASTSGSGDAKDAGSSASDAGQSQAKPVKKSANLADFIAQASVRGAETKDGRTIVEKGQSYVLDLVFAEKADLQFDDEGTLTYALPAGFAAADTQTLIGKQVTVSYADPKATPASDGTVNKLQMTVQVDSWSIEKGVLSIAWKQADEVKETDPKTGNATTKSQARADFQALAKLADAEIALPIQGSFAADTKKLELGTDDNPLALDLDVTAPETKDEAAQEATDDKQPAGQTSAEADKTDAADKDEADAKDSMKDEGGKSDPTGSADAKADDEKSEDKKATSGDQAKDEETEAQSEEIAEAKARVQRVLNSVLDAGTPLQTEAAAYKLNVQFVDSQYRGLSVDQVTQFGDITLSNISVYLQDSRNSQSTTVSNLTFTDVSQTTGGKAAATATVDVTNLSNYTAGDTVTATLKYGGNDYTNGSTLGQYDIIIQNDATLGMSTVVFRRHATPSVTINYLDESDHILDNSFLTGTYSVVAKLMNNSGAVLATSEAKTIDKTKGQVIEFEKFGDQYLGPDQHFAVFVQHGNDTEHLLEDNAVLYWEDSICQMDTAGPGVLSSPNVTLNFTKMGALEVESKLLNESGDAQTASDSISGKYYYVLAEVYSDNDKLYSLTPLVASQGSDTHKSQYNGATGKVTTFKSISGTPVYRSNNEGVNYTLVASTDPALTLAGIYGSESSHQGYKSGQVTAEGYKVKFDVGDAKTTVTLRKVNTSTTGDAINVDIKLYKDSAKTVAAADPQITEDLYMLTTLKPKGDSSGSPLAWSITKLSDAKTQLNSSGTTTVTIPKEFKLADYSMKATGSTVNFDPSLYDFTLRLYRSGTDYTSNADGYNLIRANANDTIPGYDFIGTTKAADNKSATLELHKAFKKTYRVRFNINPSGLTVATSDYYYLYIEAIHGSDRSYFLMPLTSDATQTSADVLVQYLDSNGNVVSKWQDNNGNVRPITENGFQGIDGTWATTAYLIKGTGPVNMNSAIQGTNSVRLSNGHNIKDYAIDIQKMTYSEDAGNRRDYTSIINLNKINVESTALTPFDILGNASEFGITAGRYEQGMHTETNFAIKSLQNHDNIDIDGSGENTIPFLVSRIDDGSQLWLSGDMRVNADVFVGENSESRVKSTSKLDVNIETAKEAVLDATVQELIDAGRAMSANLAAKTTIAPESDKTQYTLDTTGFPDGSTIYVNADGITNAIGNDGGLKINKLPGQSIVFNISKPGNSSANPLRIGEFTVDPNDGGGIVRSTTAALDGDPVRNKRVDEVIFEHITFNVTDAQYVHLNNTAGLFLLANADEVTQQNGSGWILAGGSDGDGGTVRSNSEWHFYRHTRRYKARGSFTIRALKKLLKKGTSEVLGYENKGFTFDLYGSADGTTFPATPDETATADANGNVYFSSVTYNESNEYLKFKGEELTRTYTFTYKLREHIPDDAVNAAGQTYAQASDKTGIFEKDGILYNAQDIIMEVKATNTRDSATATTGEITTQARIVSPVSESEFVNPDENAVYDIGTKAPFTNERDFTTINPGAKKNGDYPWETDEKFQFTLTAVSARDVNGNAMSVVPMPDGSSNGSKTVDATKADPAPKFGDITYWNPGTYTYTIAEVLPADATATIDGKEYTYARARQADSGLPGAKIQGAAWKKDTVSYDASVHTVVVTVANTNPIKATVVDGTADITANPTVTFTNKKDQTGSLKLRKLVTVNGQATTDDAMDGSYTFTIAGDPSDNNTKNEPTHEVVITVTNGRAASATVDINAVSLDREGYVEVQSLKAGSYVVTETTTGFDARGITAVPTTKTVMVEEGKTADATPDSAKASITNNLQTGGLKIQKVVVENEGTSISAGAATVTKGDYVFAVYTDAGCTTALKDESGADVTVTLHLDGASTSVTSNEISGLKPGDYWVKETDAPSNGTAAVTNPVKVTVVAGKTGTEAVIATITNNLNTGNLEVKKVVKSDVAADHTRKYPIKVELQGEAGQAINGTFGGMTFANGVANLSVGDGESIRATGLPAGISYQVTEPLSADDGQVFDAAWTGNTSDTIVKGQTKSVTVTNTRKTGELRLNKELLSDATADQQANFEFVVLLEEPISGTYSGIDFQNGRATVTVKANQTVTISGLPLGQRYSVTENTASGFELTGITVGDTDQTSAKKATGTVSVNAPVVKFTNKRLPGGLNVTKNVNSSTAADKQRQFSFVVTLYQDAAHTKREENVNGASGIYGDYGVTFTKGQATFTLKDGETKQIRNLPRGVYYVVEEQQADGFHTTAYDEVGEVTATIGTARFYNDKDEGGLRVYKRVNSKLPADKAQSKTYPITITLSDTSINNAYPASGLTGSATTVSFTNGKATLSLYDGQVVTITGLAQGLGYTVTETLSDADAQNFAVSYEGETVSADKVEGTIAETVKVAGVINTHIPGKLTVEKKVESNQISDKSRKFDFTVTLYRDSAYTTVEDTITGDFGGMTFTKGVASFSLSKDQTAVAEDLPRGVYYKVEEATPTGYVLTKTGTTDGMIEGEKTATFTNARTYVSASVQKVWNDNNNHDGIRPKKILVDLQANGRTVSTVTLPLEPAMAGHDAWYYQIDNLPMYDDAGNRLTYTWAENNVPDGYTLNADNTSDASIFSTTLTNSHTDEKTTKTVKKVWDDNNNQDGVITDETELVVALMADGEVALDANSNPITVTLKRSNNWTQTVENLPKFRADSSHTEIVYTWSEQALPKGYALTSTTTVGNTTTITNSYKPRQTEASIEKVWDDANDQDRKRPASITVTLNKTVNGTTSKVRDVVLSAANNWKTTITPLPVKEDGKDITYSWDESTVPAGYELAGNVTSGTLTTITNRHKPTPTWMEVKKIWRDGEDRDKLRPQYLTVSLMKVASDGSLVDTGIKATLSESNEWYAKVEGLAKYDQGREITYVWTEPDIPGYTLVMTYNSATLQTLTNVHVPETTAATVKKVWAGDDIDGVNKSKIPASLQVALSADGVLARDAKDNPITVTLNAANNWEATVTGLFKKDGGKDITYTWDETDLPEGFVLTNTEKTAGDVAKGEITTLTNTLKTGDLEISKNVVSDAPADKSAKYQFRVELSDKTITGTYGGMTFTNGVAEPTITVSNGMGSVKAENLPVGITYSITEAKVIYSETDQKTPAQANMTVEVTEATGEISADKTSVTSGTIVEDADESATGNQPSEAAFRNTRNKGDLRLNKTLVSDAAADKTNKFEFTVTLDDTNVNGSFELEGGSAADGDTVDTNTQVAYATFTSGVATVKLVGGQTKTIKGLPAGMGYTVTEANVPSGIAFGITDDDGDTTDGKGTIVANSMKTVTITNTRAQGGFTLSKALISDRSGEENVMFTFVVTLSDNSISGNYGTAPDNSASAAAGATIPVSFTRGRALILLKKDQTATVSGLPTGITYTITEPAVAGFSLTGITVDDTAQGTDVVSARQVTQTVSTTSPAIKFTNSREPGDLNVYKFVRSSDTTDQSKQFHFTVTLTGLSDDAKDKTYEGELLTLDTNQQVTGRSTRNVQLNNGVAEFDLTGSQAQTITGLPQGVTYTVVEDDYTSVDGGSFALPVASDSTGTINASPSNAVFLNSKTQGALVLYKQVDPTVATDQDKSFNFVIRLYKEDGVTVDETRDSELGGIQFTDGVSETISIKAGSSKYIENLPAGVTYTVQEVLSSTDADLFDLTWVAGATTNIDADTGNIDQDGAVQVAIGTIGNNSVAMAGAKNTRKPGKLSLTKVVNSGRTDDRNHTYDFVVKLYKDDGSNTVDTGISGTFGDMTFDKGVANVSITVTNGMAPTIVAEDLPVGIPYSVEEVVASGKWPTPPDITWSAKNDAVTMGAQRNVISGTVKEASTNVQITCTNTRPSGGLTVSKSVESQTMADHSKKFTFTVTLDDTGINGKRDPLGNNYGFANDEAGFVDGFATFELSDNESKTFQNLPVGVHYTVTEDTPAGFRTSWTGRTREGTIDTAGSSTAIVAKNTRIQGALHLTKVVSSEIPSDTDGTKKFKFKVSLYKDEALTQAYTEVNGNYPSDNSDTPAYNTTFANGVSTSNIELGNNGGYDIVGLPSGAYYKVEELLEGDDANLYRFEWSGQTTTDKKAATGIVPYNYQAQAIITNTREPGELDVTKHVTSNQASDNTRPFNFRVTLYSDADLADGHRLTTISGKSGVNGAYGVKFVEGVAEFTLTKDQTQKIENLPLGTYYKVEEYAASNNTAALAAYTTTKTADTTGEVVDSSNRAVKGQITTTLSTASFTNDRTETQASVQKVWDDNNDQDGKRPDTIYVNFTAQPAGGEKAVVTTAPLSESNNWSARIQKLPTHDDNGNVIAYGWEEPVENWPDGYTLTNTENDTETIGELVYDRTIFTNTHRPEPTQVSVRKIWDDANDQDGERPSELKVTLLANGERAKYANGNEVADVTLNSSDWSAKVDNLPKYKNGTEIVYTWVENEAGLPEGYELTNTERDTEEVGSGSDSVIYNRTSFTNSYKPEETTASIQKIWDDAEDQDGMRPTTLDVKLYKSYKKEASDTTKTTELERTVTLKASENWSATISGLPMKSYGVDIDYSWDEETIPAGYTYSAGTDRVVTGTLTTITNHHKPTEVSARIVKSWDDASNQDGVRPYMLTAALMKSFEEPTAGTMSTLSATEVRTVTLSSANAVASDANQWAYTIDHLPAKEDGKEIYYYWIEKDLPAGYQMTQNKTTKTDGTTTTDAVFTTAITNFHKPEETTAQVRKVWSDFNNRFKRQSANLTVKLLANGTAVTWTEAMLENAENASVKGDATAGSAITATLGAANSWTSGTINGLPKYANGNLIKYTWSEEGLPEHYTLTGDVTNAGITTLTNSIDTGRLRVYKAVDGNISLGDLTDAEKKAITFTVTGPMENPETNRITFTNTLDKFEQAAGATTASWLIDELVPGTYTVTETGAGREHYQVTTTYSVQGGQAEVKKDQTASVTVTNTYDRKPITAKVTKVWDDAENQDGIRPASLSVKLNKTVGSTATVDRTVTLNAANNWTATIENLPYFDEDNNKISYSWAEDEDDLPEGYELTNTENETAADGSITTTFTNTHEPEKVNVSVLKVWDDGDDVDDVRPDTLAVKLKANGEEVQTVALNEKNKWTESIVDLPKFANGQEIEYLWDEGEDGLAKLGYELVSSPTEEVTVEGLIYARTTLTNKHVPETVDLTVRKVWEDANNLYGVRPADLAVTLKADGKDATWTEELIDNPGNADIVGDAAVGDKIVVTLSDANEWAATVAGLPKHRIVTNSTGKVTKRGVEIAYSWSEEELPGGYELTNTQTEGLVTTITNTFRMVDAQVVKVWDDVDNLYKVRPTELKVQLMASGQAATWTEVLLENAANKELAGEAKVGDEVAITLNADNDWKATVEDLPYLDARGVQISYAWSEVDVPDEYKLASEPTETAADGSITTTLTNHKLRGKLRFTKTVHSPQKELTAEQRGLIMFEVTGPNGYYKKVTLADEDVKVVGRRTESSPSVKNTDQELKAQAEGLDAQADTDSYVAVDYEWESDWLNIAELDAQGKSKDLYNVKETNSMYQWIDTRTYRVDDGETVTSATGVDAALKDMSTTNVWISDTLVPAPLVISKELANEGTAEGTVGETSAEAGKTADSAATTATTAAASNAEFSFTIALTIDESKDVAAVRNQAWRNDEFDAIRTSKDGKETSEKVKFTDAKATVKLKAGESLAIQYLPMGVDYVVSETPTAGYELREITGTGTTDIAHASISNTISTEQVEAYEARFVNAPESHKVSVQLAARKTLTGRTLTANEFSFTLTEVDKDGKAIEGVKVQEKKNTAAGAVLFDELSYEVEGTHYYQIAEVKGNAANVTYDTHVAKVTVTVAKNDAGKLAAKVSYDKDASPTFANTYTPPSQEQKKSVTTTSTGSSSSPKTGDPTSLMGIQMLAGTGALTVLAGMLRRRRRRRDDE